MLKRQSVFRSGEAVLDDFGRQLGQPRNLAHLPQIHSLGSGNVSDRPKLAFIE